MVKYVSYIGYDQHAPAPYHAQVAHVPLGS